MTAEEPTTASLFYEMFYEILVYFLLVNWMGHFLFNFSWECLAVIKGWKWMVEWFHRVVWFTLACCEKGNFEWCRQFWFDLNVPIYLYSGCWFIICPNMFFLWEIFLFYSLRYTQGFLVLQSSLSLFISVACSFHVWLDLYIKCSMHSIAL